MANLVWPQRRELYIDARDLQSNSDPDNPLSPEEYIALLENRGREKLAEHQLVKSFSAAIRPVNPTYVLGEDFRPGDTVTVIDERLGITADAVVQGAVHSIGQEGESLELILGYGQPTLLDMLKKERM